MRLQVTTWWRRNQHGFVHKSYEPKTDNELRLKKGQIVEDIVKIDEEGLYEVGSGQKHQVKKQTRTTFI